MKPERSEDDIQREELGPRAVPRVAFTTNGASQWAPMFREHASNWDVGVIAWDGLLLDGWEPIVPSRSYGIRSSSLKLTVLPLASSFEARFLVASLSAFE